MAGKNLWGLGGRYIMKAYGEGIFYNISQIVLDRQPLSSLFTHKIDPNSKLLNLYDGVTHIMKSP